MPMTFWQAIRGTLILIALLITTRASFAQEITVFDVRKTLPLNKHEPVYQDFYINAGTEAGMKPGIVVTVKRRSTLYDAYQNRSPGDLLVPVGKLQVIHAQKGVSVARLHSLLDREDLPVLEYDYIMVGDRLDMGTAVMEGRKKGKKTAMEEGQNSSTPTANLTPEPMPAPVPTPVAPVQEPQAPQTTALPKSENTTEVAKSTNFSSMAPPTQAPVTPDLTQPTVSAPVMQ